MERAPPDSSYGWAVAVAAAVCQFVALGSINCFGVFFTPLQQTFQVGSASLAAVVSVANFVAPFVGTFAGPTADRYGAQGLIVLAALCQGASFFGASMTSSYTTFLVCYGLFAGMAAGCTISPALRIVGQWFEEKRATAMGIAFAGAGLGQVLLPPIATSLLSTYGWHYTFRSLAGLSLVVLVASTVMRPRITLEADVLDRLDRRTILKSRGFVPLFLVGFFFSYGFFIPIVHVAFYAQSLGISAMSAGYLLSVLGLLTTIGNVVWGSLADKHGNIAVFRICHFISGIALCLWPLCTSFGRLVVFAMVAGFFNGGCVTCYPALAAEIFPPQQLGGAISLIYTGFGIGSLVGPIMTGWLVDVSGSYEYAAVLGGTAFFMALAMAHFLPEPSHDEYLLETIRHCEYGALDDTPTATVAAVAASSSGPREKQQAVKRQ